MALIACFGVGYRFPDGQQALSGIDLAVAAGERLALVGANGAGKSTLLQVLAGLRRPQRGTVLLEGRAGADERAWRTAVALVLQDPDDQLLAPTVWEDVAFGPTNLGCAPDEIRRRVAEALAALAIADLADACPQRLSYGQRRRVCLAGALAMRPRVLLLDEPTAGLDPVAADALLAELQRWHSERGLALVLATHDLDRLPRLAERVAVLAEGRLLAAGPAARILGDSALLQRAGLRPPLLVRLGARLAARGLLPAPLPADEDEAEALLSEALAR